MTTFCNLSPWDVKILRCDGSSLIIRASKKYAYVKANNKVWLESPPKDNVNKIKVVGLPNKRSEDWTLVPQAVAQCAEDKHKLLAVCSPLLGQYVEITLPS